MVRSIEFTSEGRNMLDPKNGSFKDLRMNVVKIEATEMIRKCCTLGDNCVDDCTNCSIGFMKRSKCSM